MDKGWSILQAIQTQISSTLPSAIGYVKVTQMPYAFLFLQFIRPHRKTLASNIWVYVVRIEVLDEKADISTATQNMLSLLSNITSNLESDRTLGGVSASLEVSEGRLNWREGLRVTGELIIEVIA